MFEVVGLGTSPDFKELLLVSVGEMSLSEFVGKLREEYPVYGDFLAFFTIKVGDMPSKFGTWIIKIGSLYNELQTIASNMLTAYITFALLNAGYAPVDVVEEAGEGENLKEYTNYYINYMLEESNYVNIGYIVVESDINERAIVTNEYLSLKNPTECMRIALLSLRPVIMPDQEEVMIGFWSEKDTKKLVNKSIEPIEGHNCENISYFVVVDPLTYRLAKKFVQELKKELEKKLGRNVVLSTDELLDYLGLDGELINEDWHSSYREKAIKRLKKKYPFLSVFNELWRVQQAKKDINEAIAEFSKGELKEEDYNEIIRKISRGIEGYLGVLYHKYRGTPPEEKPLGWLLSSLSSEIKSEFGEDVLNDLRFINEKRKIVVHPKLVKPTIDDVIKVVRKAELFQDLFERRLSEPES